MFGIGFFEVVVVLIVFLLIGDKGSFRELLRLSKGLYLKFEGLKKQLIEYVHSSGSAKTIVGDDKKIYEVYELEEDVKNKEKNIDKEEFSGGDEKRLR